MMHMVHFFARADLNDAELLIYSPNMLSAQEKVSSGGMKCPTWRTAPSTFSACVGPLSRRAFFPRCLVWPPNCVSLGMDPYFSG
jgi:hypothetical protein